MSHKMKRGFSVEYSNNLSASFSTFFQLNTQERQVGIVFFYYQKLTHSMCQVSLVVMSSYIMAWSTAE